MVCIRTLLIIKVQDFVTAKSLKPLQAVAYIFLAAHFFIRIQSEEPINLNRIEDI